MLKLKPNEILVYRTVNFDMTSYNNFIWPTKGKVIAPDWIANFECGNGLHGLPWAVGKSRYCSNAKDSLHLVVKVDTSPNNYSHGTSELVDKCKFKSGTVVYCGDRSGAIRLIWEYAPKDAKINWLAIRGGDWSINNGGDYSTISGGDWSTNSGGNWSTISGEDRSTNRGGNYSTIKSRSLSVSIGGYSSSIVSENRSTVRGGNWSTLKGGNWSIVSGGDSSTVIGGVESILISGIMSNVIGERGSFYKSDIGSTQICRFYSKQRQIIKCRTITKAEANNWYKFEDGDWRLVTMDELNLINEKIDNGEKINTDFI